MTSVARRRDPEDSGEYSDASHDNEHNNSANDGQHESDYDSAGSDSEHSDQDPENKETERRVDDDEDRSNPQYIPKRGTFYEHDDRTAASGEESSNTTSETASEKKEGSEPATERRRPPRKSEIVNKWSHDKYNENEQMPKSRDELVAIYGYDIRNEDAPPHARRNRRYGRGPNKYTRTWEDEEAYRRTAPAPQAPPPHGPENFPELRPTRHGKPRTPRPRSKSQPAANEPSENGPQLRRNASIKTAKKPIVKPGTGRTAVKAKPTKERMQMPAIENLTITANANNNQGRKVMSVAQQRPVPTDQAKKKPINPQPQQSPNPQPNKSPPQQPPTTQQQQQKPQQQQQQNQQQQQSSSGGGSKRYSSLRQRPLADSYTPQQQQQQHAQQQPQQQQQQQQHRYHAVPPGEFVGGSHPPNAAHAHPQHMMHQQVRVNAASSPPQPQAQHALPPGQAHNAQQVRMNMEQPPMVQHAHHNIHNMPPQGHSMGVSGQIPPSQGYAPPAMMPAQYMQQTGVGAAYTPALFPAGHVPAAPPPHAAHAPHPPHVPATYAPHQIYTPHHNYATQAGGVTYYNCAEQEPPPPPRAQRRPTAAIPIVSPHHGERPAHSSEKDNIDRIVENMFVRKPWPATHSDSKEKSEPRSSQEPPSKESSQPNSLTSSSISTDSKPSDPKEEKEEKDQKVEEAPPQAQESIPTDA